MNTQPTRSLIDGRPARALGNHLAAQNDEPELHPVFAGLLQAFSPRGQADLRDIQRVTYERLLAAHDWWFEFSDDHQKYEAGKLSLAQLRMVRREVDRDGSIWNAIAPADHKVGPL